MATPAISSSSLYQEIQGFYQTRSSDVQTLGNALNAGDVNAAENAFNALVALGQEGPFANAEPFGNTDRAATFDALGQALQAGDLASAKADFAALKSWGKNQVPQMPPDAQAVTVSLTSTQASDSTQGTESIYQQVRDFFNQRTTDLKQLGDALNSGDLTAAQNAYSALVALGQNGPFANAEPFAKSDREASFEAIGNALQSGDLAGAQTAFATLQSELKSHSTEPPQMPPGTEPPTMPPAAQPPTMPPAVDPTVKHFHHSMHGRHHAVDPLMHATDYPSTASLNESA